MKQLISMALIGFVSGCAVATDPATPGNGVTATESREVGEFSAVAIQGALTATVEIGPRSPVVIEGDENLLPMVTTVVRDDKLVVAIPVNLTVRPTRPITVKISTPSWGLLETRGAARVSAQAGEAETQAVKAVGASSVKLSGVTTDALSLEGQGASTIEADGETGDMALVLTGASVARLDQLDASDATVFASGASTASVKTRDGIDGGVSGVSALNVSGPAYRRSLRIHGASRVRYASQGPRPGAIAP